MLLRIFVILIILTGVVVGFLALYLPREQIVHLIVFRDFFDVSLPILAFGALIKYLCTCASHHRHEHYCHDKDCKEKEQVVP